MRNSTPYSFGIKNKTKEEKYALAIDRFWCFVSDNPNSINKTDCRIWKGTKSKLGYGYMSVSCKRVLAHRFAYELVFGKIKEGLFCCHKCDTPSCVNPYHIFLGTQADNMRDSAIKGRNQEQKKCSIYCKHGHFLNKNSIVFTKRQRKCKVCDTFFYVKGNLKKRIQKLLRENL